MARGAYGTLVVEMHLFLSLLADTSLTIFAVSLSWEHLFTFWFIYDSKKYLFKLLPK